MYWWSASAVVAVADVIFSGSIFWQHIDYHLKVQRTVVLILLFSYNSMAM